MSSGDVSSHKPYDRPMYRASNAILLVFTAEPFFILWHSLSPDLTPLKILQATKTTATAQRESQYRWHLRCRETKRGFDVGLITKRALRRNDLPGI